MKNPNNRILFITNNYPPKTGGMEQYSYDLFTNLGKHLKIDKISNSKSRKTLPFFSIYAFIKALISSKKYSSFHYGSGVLAPIALLLKKITKKPNYITIHGLDITWKNKIYQKIIPKCLKAADKIICVSNFTKEKCIQAGIDKKNIVVIPNGIHTTENPKILKKNDWIKKYSINPEKKSIITVGRLIKRKGIKEVIENSFQKIKNINYHYYIMGDGKEHDEISKTIKESNLEKQVTILGKISDTNLNSFYKYSDLFLMPNIEIEGDMEGFGIVCIEASSWGLPVISSGIQGTKDAIVPHETGIIYNDYSDLTDKISNFLNNKLKFKSKENIQKTTKDLYSWDTIIKQYLNLYNNDRKTRNKRLL